MRNLLLALALAACASGTRAPKEPVQQASAAPRTEKVLTAPEAGPTQAPDRGAGGDSGTDAGAISGHADSAADDTTPCTKDVECSFTRVGNDDCCAMLCTPRAVTARRAKELEEGIARCRRGTCPDPACAPPRETYRPACEQNRCVAKPTGRSAHD